MAISLPCLLLVGYRNNVFYCSYSSCSYVPHHLMEEGYHIRWRAGFPFILLFTQWRRPVQSGLDPNDDPNVEKTQWSGKHGEHGKDHFAVLEDVTQAWTCAARVFLSLFYFVLFYYPSSWWGRGPPTDGGRHGTFIGSRPLYRIGWSVMRSASLHRDI